MKKLLSWLAVCVLFSGSLSAHAEKIKCANPNFCTFSSLSKAVSSTKSINNLVGHFDNKIKIVFSDIDGTIVPLGNNNTQPKTPHSAIISAEKLRKAQIPLILVTGRAPNEIQGIAKSIANDNTYFILLQGAQIINPKGQTIHEDYIKGEYVRNILNDFNRFKKANNLNSNFYMIINGKQYSTQPFVLPYNGEDVVVVKSLDDFGKNFYVAKFVVYEPDLQKCKLIQTHLKRNFPDFRVDMAGIGYVDITSDTATKGNAIKKLAGILGVDLKNAATLGDAENDISMLKEVRNSGGLSIAVGNAMDLVKENANFVTLPVYDGGFAKAIDKILDNNTLLQNRIK